VERKYQFDWSLIGDLTEGRPNLGNTTRVEVYRLMQFTFRDVLERRYGTEKADELFYEAGQIAGEEFFAQLLTGTKSFGDFVRTLQNRLIEYGIGVLRVEEADSDAKALVLTVGEDLDCSGLPELDYEVCKYDEGFISGIMQAYTGNTYQVKEVDCWCTGDRTCRFDVKILEKIDES